MEGCLTFPVAGAAYGNKGRSKGRFDKTFLTHSYHPGRDEVLCRKVRPENILADYALPGQGDPPTCAICLARDARFALPEGPATT